MKKTKLLDSYAILLWIQNEPGAQAVEDMLLSAQEGQLQLIVSELNLGEVYYTRLGRLFLIGFRFWAHYPSSPGKGFLKMT